MTTTHVNDFVRSFFVKIRTVEDKNNFYINNCLWMTTRIILMKMSIMTIKRELSGSFMVLVSKICISIILVLPCLVMYVVLISIHNSGINNYKIIKCYHAHIWEFLRVIMEKNDKRKMVIRLGRWSWKFCLKGYWNFSTSKYWRNVKNAW